MIWDIIIFLEAPFFTLLLFFLSFFFFFFFFFFLFFLKIFFFFFFAILEDGEPPLIFFDYVRFLYFKNLEHYANFIVVETMRRKQKQLT